MPELKEVTTEYETCPRRKMWVDLYAHYKSAEAAFHVNDEAADARPDSESNRLLQNMYEARERLMLAPLNDTDMTWALLEKVQILDSEMTKNAEDGAKSWAEHLVWLGAIKADITSMRCKRCGE